MKVEIKDTEKSQKEVVFTLTPKDMEPFLDKAARRLQKGMAVKGFREGNIPRAILEKNVGKTAVWQEAAPEVIEKTYGSCDEIKDIEAIGRPNIQILKLAPENNFEFRATIPVMPNLNLPDYKAIAKKIVEKEQKEVEVQDKEIEDVLVWLKKSRQDDSEAQTKQNENEKNSTEINDEFARSVGNFKDLQALKDSIKEGLTEEKRDQQKQILRLRIVEEIIKKTNIPIAESLVESELDKMEQEFGDYISGDTTSVEEYLKKIGKSFEDLRKEWREKAEQRVTTSIILRCIAEKEGINPSDEEVAEEANKYLQRFPSAEEAKKHIDPEQLRAYIRGILKNERVFKVFEEHK